MEENIKNMNEDDIERMDDEVEEEEDEDEEN